MRLLMLGGTAFLGRAIVADAQRRGWSVTVLNRGRTHAVPSGVEQLTGDRLAPGGLAALTGREFDLAVDTWSAAPFAVLDAATALADRVGHFTYVSSRSVYRDPVAHGADESAPLVDATPDAREAGYAAAKAGGELAARSVFGDRALLVRAGLILGPAEDVDRLPWWLRRTARGGDVLAPGPAGLPLQLIDARDLAAFLLDRAAAGAGGAFNAVSRTGHTTMGEVLDACVAATGGTARLRWTDPKTILDAGVEPWNDLPLWIPEGHEYRWLHEGDTSKAYAAGLVCRPIADTVADTWEWMRSAGAGTGTGKAGRPGVGLAPEKEAEILAARPRA